MNILVLCTGNSARSIMLECLLNKLGKGRVRAYSAGSKPTGFIHVQALSLLTREQHDVTRLRSKSWNEFASPDAPTMHLVITVCGNAAEEVCPIWPGAPLRGHWGVEDPAAANFDAQEAAFAQTYQTLKTRAQAFLDLPFATLPADVLAEEIMRIGTL
jgi:arsenate reductase (thioredoxin)